MCPGYLPDRIRTFKLLGVMEFADDVADCGEVPFNYNLKASNVIIQGGRLIVGRQDDPFEGNFDLEISGGRDNPPYVDPYTRSPLNDAQNILGIEKNMLRRTFYIEVLCLCTFVSQFNILK